MRTIKYRTTDGKVYNTLAEVEGKSYQVFFEEVETPNKKMSPKRLKMIEIFGRVSPKFRGTV